MSNLFIKGIAHYPALTRPDTKFDDLGQYKASVVVSEDDAADYIKDIQAQVKAHTGKTLPVAKNPLFEQMIDEDGVATGDILFKITAKNKMTKQNKLWDRKPLLIDAQKKRIPDDVDIWGGSLIKVEAEFYAWEHPGKKGVSLQPLAVQVLDLKTGSGRQDLSGFDDEDGYVSDANESGSDMSGFADETTSGSDY